MDTELKHYSVNVASAVTRVALAVPMHRARTPGGRRNYQTSAKFWVRYGRYRSFHQTHKTLVTILSGAGACVNLSPAAG